MDVTERLAENVGSREKIVHSDQKSDMTTTKLKQKVMLQMHYHHNKKKEN